MKRYFVTSAMALALCLGAAAPAAFAQEVPTVVNIAKPAAGTPVLVVLPTVELGLLTASGSTEPKQDWSDSAQKFLDDAFSQSLQTRGYKTPGVNLNTYEDPAALQILKLNDVVTSTIALNGYVKLPTKTSFDYSLGENAARLIPAAPVSNTASGDAAAMPTPAPEYALFVHVKGSYSSGGRAAMMVGMAMLGVGMPMGGQYMQATLVDLKTGQMVWYQFMVVGSGTDIRTAEGATAAAASLFKKLPL